MPTAATSPARPVRSLAAHTMTSKPGWPPPASPDDDQVWVSPADIVARRLVPLPPPVVERLLRVSAEVVQDATSASAVVRTHHQSQTNNSAQHASTTQSRSPGVPGSPLLQQPSIARIEVLAF